MMRLADPRPAWPCMWTSRAALFSAGLVLAAVGLHRFFWMPTPVVLNIIKVGYLGALAAVVLGILAMVVIWRHGGKGVPRVLFGLVVSLGLFAWPAMLWPAFSSLPNINDITTDTQRPPPFLTLAKARAEAGANASSYPGARFGNAQTQAYPDLAPLVVERSVDETYELVVATLQRMKMKIVHEELPNPRANQPGLVEATDRTLILGFLDDVSMRVTGDQRRARVDIRSASRFGTHDLGRNAFRVRSIVKELVARIEATVPQTGPGSGGPQVSAAMPRGDAKSKTVSRLLAAKKQQKVRDPTVIVPQALPDPAQADAPRAPEPKGKQPPRDERRGRGRPQ